MDQSAQPFELGLVLVLVLLAVFVLVIMGQEMKQNVASPSGLDPFVPSVQIAALLLVVVAAVVVDEVVLPAAVLVGSFVAVVLLPSSNVALLLVERSEVVLLDLDSADGKVLPRTPFALVPFVLDSSARSNYLKDYSSAAGAGAVVLALVAALFVDHSCCQKQTARLSLIHSNAFSADVDHHLIVAVADYCAELLVVFVVAVAAEEFADCFVLLDCQTWFLASPLPLMADAWNLHNIVSKIFLCFQQLVLLAEDLALKQQQLPVLRMDSVLPQQQQQLFLLQSPFPA